MTDNRWTPQDWPRLAITAAIVIYFGWALAAHYSNGLEETLKNVTMLAVGFWLGSSKGSADSAARADKALDIAASAQAASVPPTEPQPVQVVNTTDDPVNTSEAKP